MIMERRDFFKMLASGMAALGLTSLRLPESLLPHDENWHLALTPLEPAAPCRTLLRMRNGRVLVHSAGIWFGDDYRKYEAGIIEIPFPGTWHVYAEDPEYKGGFVPYVASQNFRDVFAKNGRIYFGSISI